MNIQPSPEATADSIAELAARVRSLSSKSRNRFDQIYRLQESWTKIVIPESMHAMAESHFGSVEAVRNQFLLRVDNIITGEGSLFNQLRGKRPTHFVHDPMEIDAALTSDPWKDITEATPPEQHGRIENATTITAANIAKYDEAHGILIAKDAHPLSFNLSSIEGYVDAGRRWIEATRESDPRSVYPFFLWNCLWRAGGSIIHGHAQMLLAQNRHYPQIEAVRSAAIGYAKRYGINYYDDLIKIHQDLGLSSQIETNQTLAYLTPKKEYGIMIVSPAFDKYLAKAIYHSLSRYRDVMGITSFNVGIACPPVAEVQEPWHGIPVVTSIVARGDLTSRVSDIGGMELFATPVIASNPLFLASVLRGGVST
mgnify:CR=1 FL=1